MNSVLNGRGHLLRRRTKICLGKRGEPELWTKTSSKRLAMFKKWSKKSKLHKCRAKLLAAWVKFKHWWVKSWWTLTTSWGLSKIPTKMLFLRSLTRREWARWAEAKKTYSKWVELETCVEWAIESILMTSQRLRWCRCLTILIKVKPLTRLTSQTQEIGCVHQGKGREARWSLAWRSQIHKGQRVVHTQRLKINHHRLVVSIELWKQLRVNHAVYLRTGWWVMNVHLSIPIREWKQ